MSLRNTWLGLLAALVILLGGCRKSAIPDKAEPSHTASSAPMELVAQIHWLGKSKADGDTNYSGIVSIWNLPEARALETQVLSNLVSWALSGSAKATLADNLENRPLMPILREILQEGVFLEVLSSSNGVRRVYAVMPLPAARMATWRTNFSMLCEGLGFLRDAATPENIWTKKKDGETWSVESLTLTNWIAVSFGNQAEDSTVKLVDLIQRAQTEIGLPTSALLHLKLSPAILEGTFSGEGELLSTLSMVDLSVSGTGPGVRIAADVDFKSGIPVHLEAWDVPTNIISDPLISFTAVRGIREWLGSTPIWRELNAGEPPDQVFFWAQTGMPFLSYIAAPCSNGTAILTAARDTLLPRMNDFMTNNGIGYFSYRSNRIEWLGSPLMTPFLMVPETRPTMIMGGLAPLADYRKRVPDALLAQLDTPQNTMYYDWEFTSARLEQWMNFSQLTRLATGKAQLPPGSASFAWLRALEGHLENSGTRVRITGTNHLSLVRNSTIGLTAPELILFADWLESPTFPKGLRTLVGKPDVIYPKRNRELTLPGGPEKIK